MKDNLKSLLAPCKRVCLAVTAALTVFAAAELVYRCWWSCLRAGALAADKGGLFSLYIVGESTAVGEPYEGIGLHSLIVSPFAGRINGKRIQVFHLAAGGESVYPQYAALERSLRYRNPAGPGAVIVYSGNNDAALETGVPVLERVREYAIARSLLLADLNYYAEKYFPPLRVRTLGTYEHYMRRIVEVSLHSGLLPVVSTVVSNVSGIDPQVRLRAGQTRADAESVLAPGLALESRRGFNDAIRYYSLQAEKHPWLRAYLEYRIGKCYQASGRYSDAGRRYKAIIDSAENNVFGRASGRQNDFIRGLAAQYGVPLVDAVKIFEAHSAHGLIGDSLLCDGHHPNMTGYLLLSGEYVRKISKAFKEPVSLSFSSPDEVFRHYSYGPGQQALSFFKSGKWLLNSSAQHAYPLERLGLARASFQKAIALDPRGFSAWLGLGLTEAALNGGLLSTDKNLRWLSDHGLSSYGEYAFTREQLPLILEKLSSSGAAEATVKQIAALAEGAFTPEGALLNMNMPGSGNFSSGRNAASRLPPVAY